MLPSIDKSAFRNAFRLSSQLKSRETFTRIDFQELYRYLIDDFLIQYCQKLKPKDFIAKSETWNNKTSKRIYLNNAKTRDLMLKLNDYFRCMVKMPRIMRGEKQEFETLINEEALLFAKYLRNEREGWVPRIAIPTLPSYGVT